MPISGAPAREIASGSCRIKPVQDVMISGEVKEP